MTECPECQTAMRLLPAQKGFSLVEAAVVLGVIGIITGGIWIAASMVSESLKYSQISQNTLMMVQGIRQMYKNVPLSSDIYLTDFASNGNDQITRMGIVPQDMISGSRLVDPWGNQINVILPSNPTQMNQVIIHFRNMTIARCIRLWREFGIKQFDQMTGWLSSTSSANSTLLVWDTAWGRPSDLTAAQCSNGGYITMVFKRAS